MALQNVEANITLDLYNHDTTPATVKAIQLDSQTRYVAAMLQSMGAQYDVDSGATVQLIVVRPDKVGVQITGTTFTYGDEGAQFLGPYAELTQVALAVNGKMRGQFKITSGTQILRTEIFTISNGEALDASTDEWADEYDGYNLEEMATSIETNTAGIATLEADVSQIKEDFNELPKIATPEDSTAADLYICDANGNVLAKFEDGHIKTKNFDSSEVGTDMVKEADKTDADLYICDSFGNVLAEFKNGHIATKNFDSSGIASDISEMSENIEKNTDEINALKRARVRMKFGAHNGAEWYAPECSIPAYRIAGQQRWEWAWVAGIYFSTDGTMYVIHDNTVDRTTDGTGKITEMTDAQINALHIDQSGGTRYDLSDFDPAELIVPTLEQVIQQCVLYDMKMVLRLDNFPKGYTEQDSIAKWDYFVDLLKSYNVAPSDISCYVITGTHGDICRNLLGEDVEISTFLGRTGTAQQFIDWFSERNLTGNRAAIININNVDIESVKLLHSNGIRVYAYDESPSEQNAMLCASLGVDIYQNAKIYRIVEEG